MVGGARWKLLQPGRVILTDVRKTLGHPPPLVARRVNRHPKPRSLPPLWLRGFLFCVMSRDGRYAARSQGAGDVPYISSISSIHGGHGGAAQGWGVCKEPASPMRWSPPGSATGSACDEPPPRRSSSGTRTTARKTSPAFPPVLSEPSGSWRTPRPFSVCPPW